MVVLEHEPLEATFTAFARALEPRLRVALMARFGPDGGREAASEAIAWAWEHWERVARVDNPGGYLYRVGVRRAQRGRWKPALTRAFDRATTDRAAWVEPGLSAALGRLSPNQRQAVVLVEGYGFSYSEVAELLGVRRATVQTHVTRALERLRIELGVHQ